MVSRQNLDRLVGRIKWGEDTLALVIFSAMSILPVIETIARLFGTNIIPASQAIVQHCTLWIGFLGFGDNFTNQDACYWFFVFEDYNKRLQSLVRLLLC